MQKKQTKKITQKTILKYNLCEHHKVGYVQLQKLCETQIKYIKKKDRVIENLSKDIERKSWLMAIWQKEKKDWINKVDQQLLAKVDKIEEDKAYYEKQIDDLQELYEGAIEHNREILKLNQEGVKINQKILKDHNEITRAYNGLADMGRFVEKEVIDRHNKMLPENDQEEFTDFKQKHTLLENGKVLHEWSMKKKKKKDEGQND
jgi:hypothetical protein